MRRIRRGAIGCAVWLVACGGAVRGVTGVTDGKDDGGSAGGSAGGNGRTGTGGAAVLGTGGPVNGSGGIVHVGDGGFAHGGAGGNADAGGGDAAPPCVFGTSIGCLCNGRPTGARLCLVSGVYGKCSCPAEVPTCQDGTRNGTETDVDCGGPTCSPCAIGAKCSIDVDCATASCFGHVCARPPFVDAGTTDARGDSGSASPEGAPAPGCADGVKNGTESDVDCGGACPQCLVGHTCVADADCVTNLCLANLCLVPR